MSSQHKLSESVKSIAGAALIGVGLHILWGNLDKAATQVSHPLGASAADALGVLPSIAMAFSQVVQAYASNHQGFLLGVLRMLVSFWPLLMVVAGTMLLRDTVTEKVKALPTPKNIFKIKLRDVDFATPRSTCR